MDASSFLTRTVELCRGITIPKPELRMFELGRQPIHTVPHRDRPANRRQASQCVRETFEARREAIPSGRATDRRFGVEPAIHHPSPHAKFGRNRICQRVYCSMERCINHSSNNLAARELTPFRERRPLAAADSPPNYASEMAVGARPIAPPSI